MYETLTGRSRANPYRASRPCVTHPLSNSLPSANTALHTGCERATLRSPERSNPEAYPKPTSVNQNPNLALNLTATLTLT